MRIVIAPDSFKGSLSARQAARAMQRGVLRALPRAQAVLLPLSDGGEGLLDALLPAGAGQIVSCTVRGPLGKEIQAELGFIKNERTAVIEMAQASGLTLLKKQELNPLKASSYGTGQLIKAALDQGAEHLIIGLGGSATSDGGLGMAQALGFRFFDAEGKLLGSGGGELIRLAEIDRSGADPRLKEVKIEAACDVSNPLLGPKGAARVYGPQKGASPAEVELLERGLKNYAGLLEKDLKRDIASVPGAGAAGGLGAGLMALLGADLRSGIELALNRLEFDELIKGADLVLTGEGKLDAQSTYGKVPLGVARRCRKSKVPAVALAGAVLPEAEQLHREGVAAYFSLANQPLSLEESMQRAAELLELAAAEVIRLFAYRGGGGPQY